MHVAIIMDGNGRWATQRGLPRTAGHIEGAKAVRTTVEAAARADIEVLTLYAFSSANWARPAAGDRRPDAPVRPISIYRDPSLRGSIDPDQRHRPARPARRKSASVHRAKRATECGGRENAAANSRRLLVPIQHLASRAARRVPTRNLTAGSLPSPAASKSTIARLPAGEVDLLIRTGNERRLSDFLLWESAFAELHFSDCLWPDFDERRFRNALEDYHGRHRRFGGLHAKTL